MPEVTKNVFSWVHRFPEFINRKYLTLILKMIILINCTGRFSYLHGIFQNTEATTGGVLKIQIKVSQNSPESTSEELDNKLDKN